MSASSSSLFLWRSDSIGRSIRRVWLFSFSVRPAPPRSHDPSRRRPSASRFPHDAPRTPTPLDSPDPTADARGVFGAELKNAADVLEEEEEEDENSPRRAYRQTAFICLVVA